MKGTIGSALLLLACTATARDQEPESILPLNPQSYVDLRRLWPRAHRPIPVCWEASATDTAAQKWVEDGVHEIMEEVSVIRFAGTPGIAHRWPRCTDSSLGIRIAGTAGRPRSLVGWQGPIEGDPAHEAESATIMQLNFGTGLYGATCANRRRACTRYLAAHEFAHAIGFLHEHLRSDASPECKALAGSEADDPGYNPAKISLEFDPLSITNYCANIFADPMPIARLSQYDVRAINLLYGPG